MAITYTWTIESMSVLQTPEPDFVVIVNWLCSGTDGTNVAESGGNSTFTQQEGPTFVPYANLTETLVLGWVTDELGENGVTSAEGCVEGQINSIVTPPVSPTPKPLPW
tara:strand:- start:734 stop:1057 length:324 start_codon:yes stop_codon:yes gene_type:complete